MIIFGLQEGYLAYFLDGCISINETNDVLDLSIKSC